MEAWRGIGDGTSPSLDCCDIDSSRLRRPSVLSSLAVRSSSERTCDGLPTASRDDRSGRLGPAPSSKSQWQLAEEANVSVGSSPSLGRTELKTFPSVTECREGDCARGSCRVRGLVGRLSGDVSRSSNAETSSLSKSDIFLALRVSSLQRSRDARYVNKTIFMMLHTKDRTFSLHRLGAFGVIHEHHQLRGPESPNRQGGYSFYNRRLRFS